ncbi:MAG: hypothetical protein ABI156_01765 [Caldimonas sp.]
MAARRRLTAPPPIIGGSTEVEFCMSEARFLSPSARRRLLLAEGSSRMHKAVSFEPARQFARQLRGLR